MAYGTAAMVAALTRRYTNAGSYDGTTNPTSTTVGAWLDQISGTLDLLLAEKGFTVPVTQSSAKLALDAIANEAAADLCQAANSAGRFFTDRALERGVAPMVVIRNEMAAWVDAHAEGFEAIGAGRNIANAGGIGYRDGDEDGNEISPLFGRNTYGADPRNR